VVLLGPEATGNRVRGNLIGTDATGLHPLGNHAAGVGLLGAASNFIGEPRAGNLISGNQGGGVGVESSTASLNLGQGNLTGTNRLANAAIPNAGDGVLLQDAGRNRIGGATPTEANVIAANLGDGVHLQGLDAVGNDVQGNWIGTSPGNSPDLGNQGAG